MRPISDKRHRFPPEDRRQPLAAARAVPVLDVDHFLVARQVRRQGAMITSRSFGAGTAHAGRTRVLGLLSGLIGSDGLLEILEPELQLVGSQLLGAATKLVACQTLDQQPQLIVLGVQRALLQ